MYNEDTEVLFPPRLIPLLRDLRGETWRELAERVAAAEPMSTDRLAFVLLMVRLSGCVSCSSDSYRAMRGCTQCAVQTVRRYRGDDQDLLDEFQAVRDEVLRQRKI